MSTRPYDDRPPLVVLAGPTAAGKSAWALRLAERFGGEILNADSMQVYCYLDIGTAKPTLAERARVPHHLLDVVRPDEAYNAGRYARDARAAAARVHGRGRPAFVSGGTGLYVRALLEGLLEGPAADRELRERLSAAADAGRAAGDPARLHRRLTELDPEAAARIHPHDEHRLVRALELCLRTGRPVSHLQRVHGFADRPYRVLYLVLDPGREPLDARIDARCVAMIEGGLLQELRALRKRGYGPELRPLQAIGYRHVNPVVDGLDTLANALTAMQRDTRRFARRQRTWLRRVPEAIWLHPDDEDAITKGAEAFLVGGRPGPEACRVPG